MDMLRSHRDPLLLVIAAMSLIAAGCLPAPGADNAFYVLLPYAVAVVGTALCVAARYDLTFRHLPPEGIDPATRQGRLSRRALIATVAAFACAMDECAYLLTHGAHPSFGYGGEPSPHAPFYAAGYVLLMLLAGFCLARLYHGSRS